MANLDKVTFGNLKMHYGAVSIASKEGRAFSTFKNFPTHQSRTHENWFKVNEADSTDGTCFAYAVPR